MNFKFTDNIQEHFDVIYTIKGRKLIKKFDKLFDFDDDIYLGKLFEININNNILPDIFIDNKYFIIIRPISINNNDYFIQTLKNIVFDSNINHPSIIGKIIYSNKNNMKFIKTKKIKNIK
jgi:hypothetical protein